MRHAGASFGPPPLLFKKKRCHAPRARAHPTTPKDRKRRLFFVFPPRFPPVCPNIHARARTTHNTQHHKHHNTQHHNNAMCAPRPNSTHAERATSSSSRGGRRRRRKRGGGGGGAGSGKEAFGLCPCFPLLPTCPPRRSNAPLTSTNSSLTTLRAWSTTLKKSSPFAPSASSFL